MLAPRWEGCIRRVGALNPWLHCVLLRSSVQFGCTHCQLAPHCRSNSLLLPPDPPARCLPTCSVLLLVDASIPPMPLDIASAAWFAEAEVRQESANQGLCGAVWCPTAPAGHGRALPDARRRCVCVCALQWGPCAHWDPCLLCPLASPLLFGVTPVQIPFTIVFTKLDKRKKGVTPSDDNIAAFEQVGIGIA